MDLKIYNGVAHNIDIVSGATLDASIRKFVGGDVVFTIPRMGMLNATMTTTEMGIINGIIPVFKTEVGHCDPLLKGFDIYVVSPIYASAYVVEHGPDSRIYTVSNPVMTNDGKTFRGCCGLSPYCN